MISVWYFKNNASYFVQIRRKKKPYLTLYDKNKYFDGSQIYNKIIEIKSIRASIVGKLFLIEKVYPNPLFLSKLLRYTVLNFL